MIVIYERNGWKLSSQGRGATYLLERGALSVFFQGDDSQAFRESVMGSDDGFLIDNCE